jgi:FAD-dependent urate hydroxylase
MALSDVTILGAGPYGLATAAALRSAGLTVSVHGTPMSFWENNMPTGMLLRSPYAGSSIGDPSGPLSLDAYAADTGTELDRPMPLQQFIGYGRWVQRGGVPDVDGRRVVDVDRDDGGFQLLLEDGEEVSTSRLVVAAGIGYFPHVPELFEGLPPELVSHASAHRDLTRWRGLRVLVVGAGQSALESAALLRESGAAVRVTARAGVVHWLGQRPWLRSLGPVSSLLYAPAEVGPPLLCQLVQLPGIVHRLPPDRRHQLDHRAIRPAGAAWLRPRVVGVLPLSTGRDVVGVRRAGDRVAVTFDDGQDDVFDHVLLGTGYRVDITRYPFLSRRLLSEIRRVDGYPILGRGFESSVPGLHFVGAPAAGSFGPLMRFVAGSSFASAEISRALVGVGARGRRERSGAHT